MSNSVNSLSFLHEMQDKERTPKIKIQWVLFTIRFIDKKGSLVLKSAITQGDFLFL